MPSGCTITVMVCTLSNASVIVINTVSPAKLLDVPEITGCGLFIRPSSFNAKLPINAVSGSTPSVVSRTAKIPSLLASKLSSKERLFGSTDSAIRANSTKEVPPPEPAAALPPAAVASKLSNISPPLSRAFKKSLTLSVNDEASVVDVGSGWFKLAIASSILSSKMVVSELSLAASATKSGVICTR
ncbi:hypothetical protein PSMA108079_11725 [Pseudoalteromonas mariniglutinosa]